PKEHAMNCHAFRTALALLVLVAGLSCAGPAVAGTPVPHKESADGKLTLVINPTPANPLGTMKFAGQGVATQMGAYSQVGGHNFTAPNAQGVGLVLGGTFTSTAADGSTISGTYAGTYTLLPNNMIRFDVTAVWLSGTGRLSGVTGQAAVVALLNATTGNFHYATSAPGSCPERGLGSAAPPIARMELLSWG